jgi:DNA polymerase III subunit gamma/tau
MSTLYRNYRPQNFSEILGQKHIKITLQNEISTGKLAQAFLFCGPRAVGKTTMARVLAKSVNCLNRQENDYEPCGKCNNCQDITAGNHLDVIEIDAASNTGVDNVRENIISFSRLVPSRAKYKIFIIDEVHMLSPSAFNALLKIIEEPPPYVIFILCTTEVHKVPYTIVSRCERFDFKKISIFDIVTKLKLIAKQEKKEIDTEILEAVARRSNGHLRDAESLLGQIFSLGDKRISLEQAELVMPHYNNSEVIELLSYFPRKDTVKALALVNSLADSGASIKNFISEIIFMVRKMIIFKISPQLSDSLGLNLGDALEIKINELSASLSLNQLLFYIKRLLISYDDKNQLILQLPLELAVIEICSQEVGTVLKARKEELISKNEIESVLPNNNLNSAAVNSKDSKKDSVSPLKIENNKRIDINLDHNQIMEKWPEFLMKIKKYNHSLSFVLQNCEPQEINSGCLRLIFKYKFHQDRVKDENIKNLIENTLIEVFGIGINLKTELDENLAVRGIKNQPNDEFNNLDNSKAQRNKDDSLMNNLLKTFGGEVIN